MAGTALVAWLLQRRGPAVSLGVIGTLRVLACLIFTLHAAGLLPGLSLLFGAAALQTLIRYTELVVLFSLFMAVASPAQPGTDFTILACAQYAAYLLGSVAVRHPGGQLRLRLAVRPGDGLSAVVLAGSMIWCPASPLSQEHCRR